MSAPVTRLPAPALPDWLAPAVPYERCRINVGPYAMHVMEQGAGTPVLMVHGNPTWGFLWRKVVHALGDAPLRSVMPDLIGLGLSDHPKDPRVHSIDFHVTHLAGLVEALELKRFVLVVQDWGGPIGVGVAAKLPERVAGLVVLNTAITPPKEGFKPTAFHRFARVPVVSDLVFRGLNFPADDLNRVQHDKRSIDTLAARAYRWPLADRSRNAAPLALARMVPDSLEHPSVPALRKTEEFALNFKGPAAIVWGKHDPILGRLANRTHRLLPHATLELVDAGHFLQEEVPDVIAAAIKRVAGV